MILVTEFAQTAHSVRVDIYTVRVVQERVTEFASYAKHVQAEPPNQEAATTVSQTPYAVHVPHAIQTNNYTKSAHLRLTLYVDPVPDVARDNI